MKVVFLSWEYPPRIVGELAWLVQSQIEGLRRKGLEVELVTVSDSGFFIEEPVHGLRITRISSPVYPHSTIITWIAAINTEAARVVADIYHSTTDKLILHTHDWHFAPATSSLKKALKIPWVVSLYSIEQQRSLNPNSPLSSCIRTIEWHMARECDTLLVRNEWMLSEVRRSLPLDRVAVMVLDPSSPSWGDEVLRLYNLLVKS
ncbi:MAG: glycosyltransferase [Nitrososphaerota archaeon]